VKYLLCSLHAIILIKASENSQYAHIYLLLWLLYIKTLKAQKFKQLINHLSFILDLVFSVGKQYFFGKIAWAKNDICLEGFRG